jgi:hypothetical protein
MQIQGNSSKFCQAGVEMDSRSTFPDSCFETDENVMPKRALWRHFGISVGRVGIQPESWPLQ